MLEKRKELNLTQKELADKIGLTDRAISRWERGIGCPDISFLEPLASTLHISVLELLHGEEGEYNENKIVVNLLKKNKKTTNLWRILSIFLLNTIGIIFLTIYLLFYQIPKTINKEGMELYTMVSGSMEPALKPWDIVAIKKTNINRIQVGDVITFISNVSISEGMTVTHRVTKKEIANNGSFLLVTKGDNNLSEDTGRVTKDNLIGKVSFILPKWGKLLHTDIICEPISPMVGNGLLLCIFGIIFFDINQITNRKKNLY